MCIRDSLYSMQLFFIKNPENEIILSKQESKHVTKVLRKKSGDILNFTDGKGGLYLQKGTQITEIVDPNGGSVHFAPIKWGGIKKEQKAYAAEAVLKDGDIASYNLLVKETETDAAGNVTTKWNNYEVSTLGVLDQASKRSSDDAEYFEKDLNQDLNGNSKIFNPESLTLSAETTFHPVYFFKEDQLARIQRPLPAPVFLDAPLNNLLEGPSEREAELGMVSAIPAGTAIVDVALNRNNTISIHLNQTFFEIEGEQRILSLIHI